MKLKKVLIELENELLMVIFHLQMQLEKLVMKKKLSNDGGQLINPRNSRL